MKKVLIVAQYTNIPGEKGYHRHLFLYDYLSRNGYDVTLVTSSFDHYNKVQRDINFFRSTYPDYKVVLLKTPSYYKNISLKRIICQRKFALELNQWLTENGRNYDVVYTGIPTLESGDVCGSYCNKNGIQYIIDVQDLWPEAMRLVVKNALLFDIVFADMKKLANKVYSQADQIVAVSNEYAQRAFSVNHKCAAPSVIYIGTLINKFDTGANKTVTSINKKANEIWITYIGTLGISYDLFTLIRAAKLLENRGYSNIVIKILGRGPGEVKIKEYAKQVNCKVNFIGYVEYDVMAAYLVKSDMAVNAFKRNAAQSIATKVSDYLTAGLPILNGSMCNEMITLIEDNKIGLNYEPENAKDLADKIEQLIKSTDLRKLLGENAREFAERNFDKQVCYKKVIDLIEHVTDGTSQVLR